MAQVVFILGAGASKEGGAPLMAEFFDVASDLYQRREVEDSRDEFETLFRARGDLQTVHSKSNLDIYNIESVFAAFEMARIIGGFGDYDEDRIRNLIDAVKTVIVRTIERSMSFPVDHDRRPRAPKPYLDFAKLIHDVSRSNRDVSVITFNYDMALDFAFHARAPPVFYGFGDEKKKNSVPVLKLHGSLNWGKCSKCGIVTWDIVEYQKKYGWPPTGNKNPRLEIGSHIGEFEHCPEGTVEPSPVIVPPTWNKTEYHSTLSSVWTQAKKELAEAEYIFIIGYSLPDSDSFFRFLYALGTVSAVPLRGLYLVNPDADVEAKFGELLGTGAKDRFVPIRAKFSDSLAQVRRELS